jgi:hypothetical protein
MIMRLLLRVLKVERQPSQLACLLTPLIPLVLVSVVVFLSFPELHMKGLAWGLLVGSVFEFVGAIGARALVKVQGNVHDLLAGIPKPAPDAR